MKDKLEVMIMKFKKTIGIVLVFVLLFSLAACANNNTSDQTQTSAESATTASAAGSATSAENTTSGKKAIVIYFSGSGNTKRVAELVANETGSELFELVPTTPYTDDDLNYRDENSRVIKEHNDPSLQNTELTSIKASDWESYDTVLFGYPLWWREAAWPVNSFVKGNDFSGKTVIPFCTSTSDGIGDSGSKLAQMAGTGTWQEGMRFSEREEESAVKEWAQGIGLK
jgi:flavodoxin